MLQPPVFTRRKNDTDVEWQKDAVALGKATCPDCGTVLRYGTAGVANLVKPTKASNLLAYLNIYETKLWLSMSMEDSASTQHKIAASLTGDRGNFLIGKACDCHVPTFKTCGAKLSADFWRAEYEITEEDGWERVVWVICEFLNNVSEQTIHKREMKRDAHNTMGVVHPHGYAKKSKTSTVYLSRKDFISVKVAQVRMEDQGNQEKRELQGAGHHQTPSSAARKPTISPREVLSDDRSRATSAEIAYASRGSSEGQAPHRVVDPDPDETSNGRLVLRMRINGAERWVEIQRCRDKNDEKAAYFRGVEPFTTQPAPIQECEGGGQRGNESRGA
ncbi:hypothetical protein C8R45DRAFT_942740 [Mycena sanguinolenta]|nr:hypothetical protein C8R45DRAFT_942740 [Mycena sanguinolenta]